MDFSVIVACCNDGGIGIENHLPWYLPEDLKHFKMVTSSVSNSSKRNVVIMGRLTWLSLPFKPLPSRLNIIVSTTTSSQDYSSDQVVVVDSLDSAVNYLVNRQELLSDIDNVFVIGGSRLINESLVHPNCTKIYVTHVLTTYKCDTHLNLQQLTDHFNLTQEGNINNFNNTKYIFCVYTRKIES